MTGKVKTIIAGVSIAIAVLTPTGFAAGYKAHNDYLKTELEQQSDSYLQSTIDELQESLDTAHAANNVLTNKVNSLTSEKNYYKTLVDDLRADVSEAETLKAQAEADRDEALANYNAVSLQLEEKEKEIETAQNDLQVAQTNLARVTSERDSLIVDKVSLEEELAANQESITSLTAEKNQLQQNYDTVSLQLEVKEQELAEANEELSQTEASLATVTEQRDNLQTEKEQLIAEGKADDATIADLNAQIETKNKEISALEEEQQANVQLLEAITEEKNNLAADKESLQQQLNTANSNLETVTQERDTLQTNYNNVSAQLASKEEELAAKQNELDVANQTITTLTEERDSLQSEKTQLQADYNDLTERFNQQAVIINSKLEEIQRKENIIKNKDEIIKSLNATIAENNTTISQLQADLDAITEENDENILQIASLETQITNLNNEIERLNGLIKEYEDLKDAASEVSFYLDGVSRVTYVVKNGDCVSMLPTIADTTILGYTLEDGTSVDPLTYTITEDTIFYIQAAAKYTATFKDGNSVVTTLIVEEGKNLAWPTAPVKDGWTFDGWYLGDEKYTEADTYSMNGDVTFTAQYYQWERVTSMIYAEDEEFVYKYGEGNAAVNLHYSDMTEVPTGLSSSNRLFLAQGKDENYLFSGVVARGTGVIEVSFEGKLYSGEYVLNNFGGIDGEYFDFTLTSDDNVTKTFNFGVNFDEIHCNNGYYQHWCTCENGDTYFLLETFYTHSATVTGYTQYVEVYKTLY